PSQLSSTVMANIHTSISLNQKNSGDISAVAANLLLDEKQRDQLSMLKVGEAIVRLSDRFLTPFMIKTDIVPIKEQTVTDAAIRDRTAAPGDGCSAYSQPETPQIRPEPADSANDKLTDDEIKILGDIMEYPFIGVAKRYKRLFLSARKGNDLKEALAGRGIIETEEINTGNANLVLLKPTDAGLKLARELGIEHKKVDYRASLEHEYWRHKAANFCKALGYQVAFEVPVNGNADIVARKADLAIAIEVETGKNNILYAVGNIKKNLTKGFERVISLVSDGAFLERLRLQLKEENLDSDERIKTLPAHQFCAGKTDNKPD
ncbi:MAG: hypothetical protein UY62_C0012G0001, partial [Parcubacteria group bacterium GW2011_GWF2_50_9]